MNVTVTETGYTVEMKDVSVQDALDLAAGLDLAKNHPDATPGVKAICGQLRGALNTATNEL